MMDLQCLICNQKSRRYVGCERKYCCPSDQSILAANYDHDIVNIVGWVRAGSYNPEYWYGVKCQRLNTDTE